MRPLHVELSEQEDKKLMNIEKTECFKPKVRLRASSLRLSNQGWRVPKIAAYLGRGEESIRRDLKRWREQGLEGLADGTAPGQAPLITNEIKSHLVERLGEERTWTAPQLADEVALEFKIEVTAEAIRQHLKRLGYFWKRTRYVPCKEIDPETERQHRVGLDTLKRGRQKNG